MKKSLMLLAMAGFLCALGPAWAQGGAALETIEQKVSYSMGNQMAESYKSQGFDLDVTAFTQGLKDAMAGKDSALDEEQQREAMMEFSKIMQAKRQEKANSNISEGAAFLEANKAKEGVVALESGLQYKVIKEGTGASPTVADSVEAHYKGTLLDGTEFDSSYKRNKPSTFPLQGVIKGWTEGLQLMKEGGKYQLFIPSDLAYGPQGRSSIPPNSTLIFEIELIKVISGSAQ